MSNQRRFALLGNTIGTPAWLEAAQDAVGGILTDSSEINFTYTDGTPSITAALIDASIVFARLQNADAVSVLGRAANSAGVLDEIAAGANDRILRRTSDALNFGQLTAGMFPNTVVPDAALSSNVPLLDAANVFTSTLQISSAQPTYRFNETDAGTDEKIWDFLASASGWAVITRDDGGGFGAQPFAMTRSGVNISLITLATGASVSALQLDTSTTAGNTRLLVYDVDNAALERVSVGAADSGGAGFKVLRIPN